MLSVFCNPVGEILVIEVGMLAFLEGLLQARILELSNLLAEGGNSPVVISWAFQLE